MKLLFKETFLPLIFIIVLLSLAFLNTAYKSVADNRLTLLQHRFVVRTLVEIRNRGRLSQTAHCWMVANGF